MGCHFLLQHMKVKIQSEVAQSFPTPSDPMECNLPGSSIHRIFQARVLQWFAIAFSDGITSKSKICTLGWQSGDPGMLMVQFWSKGPRVSEAYWGDPSPRAGDDQHLSSTGRKQKGKIFPSSTFLFYSGPIQVGLLCQQRSI